MTQQPPPAVTPTRPVPTPPEPPSLHAQLAARDAEIKRLRATVEKLEIECQHYRDSAASVGEADGHGLAETIHELRATVENLGREKERRVYYQNIVYTICNQIDRCRGETVTCGTVDQPCTDAQDAVRGMAAEIELYRIAAAKSAAQGKGV